MPFKNPEDKARWRKEYKRRKLVGHIIGADEFNGEFREIPPPNELGFRVWKGAGGRTKTNIKRTHCWECGYIPPYACLLDVDHIDGDSKSEDPNNFQVLCANCHRLKTHRDRHTSGLRCNITPPPIPE